MRFSIRTLLCPALLALFAAQSAPTFCRADDPPDDVFETFVEIPLDEFWDGFRADHPICCPWLELLPSKKGDKWGFVDRKGELVVKHEFDHVQPFREGLAVVRKAEKSGFIDRSGKVAIPIEFDVAIGFSEGLAGVMKKDQGSYIDRSGKSVLQLDKGTLPLEFHEGCAVVGKAAPGSDAAEYGFESFGIINKRGQYIVKPEYSPALSMSHGRAWLNKDDRWFCVDSQGKVLGDVRYQAVAEFREGLAAVVSGEKWGYIGTDLKIVIPAQFDETHGFSEGLAPVALGGKWGFIDVRGTMVVKPSYDVVAPADLKGAYVRDSKAIVLKDGWWLEFDSSGRELAKLGKSAIAKAKPSK